MIAHRLTTVEPCDEIFVLDAGTLSASGRYAELAGSAPVFRRMVLASS